MGVEFSVKKFKRSRHLDWDALFVDNKTDGIVRPEWSSLYQAFCRNNFVLGFRIAEVAQGEDEEVVMKLFEDSFDRIENYCDSNCTGMWCLWIEHIDDKTLQDAKEVSPSANVMFEHESDLMDFIKNCALLLKLAM